jgi:galactose mutarotase-like enzyme
MEEKMNIKKDVFKGIESLVLENEYIKAIFLPKYGSKLASLINKKTNREIFFQAKEEKLIVPEYSSKFSKYDSSGFDEVFPSIDEAPYPEGKHRNKIIPDHGEVWALSWDYEIKSDYIIFSVKSPVFDYIFSKKVKLNNNKLEFEYTVKNLNDEEFKYIWTPHALINPYDDAKIIAPERFNKIITVEHNSEHLGEWGTIHNYPMTISKKTNKEIDMSLVEPVEANNCEKFYFLDKLEKNDVCGIEYTKTKEKVIYRFDTEKIPYLGVWKTQGGYRGDYNIAIEPCTGIYDDLYVANKIKKVASVDANSSVSWDFVIELVNE